MWSRAWSSPSRSSTAPDPRLSQLCGCLISNSTGHTGSRRQARTSFDARLPAISGTVCCPGPAQMFLEQQDICTRRRRSPAGAGRLRARHVLTGSEGDHEGAASTEWCLGLAPSISPRWRTQVGLIGVRSRPCGPWDTTLIKGRALNRLGGRRWSVERWHKRPTRECGRPVGLRLQEGGSSSRPAVVSWAASAGVPAVGFLWVISVRLRWSGRGVLRSGAGSSLGSRGVSVCWSGW